MGNLHALRERLLHDGQITPAEVDVIRDYVHSDGQLDLSDVKLLVELLTEAREVCPEFDELFFPALKRVILADGRIGADESFYLLKMIYADGRIRDSERRFLRELLHEATEVPPEFQSLCDIAFAAPEANWDVGGVAR